MEWLFRLFGKILSVKIEPKLTVTQFCLIRHFRNEKGTAAKMCGAIVSGIVTWEAPALSQVPEVHFFVDQRFKTK